MEESKINNNRQMLSLQNKKPLCYMISESNLIQSLPYVDQDLAQFKSKVIYHIKKQQKQNMVQTSVESYIQSLKVPLTPFLSSQKFQKQLERVKIKINQDSSNKNQATQKDQNLLIKKKTKLAQVDKDKLLKGKVKIDLLRQKAKQIDSSHILIQQAKKKNINLEMSKLFGPTYLKGLIDGLEKQKKNLQNWINKQKQDIQLLNQQRKYEQLQAAQRQQTIKQRIKIMVYKKRKIE